MVEIIDKMDPCTIFHRKSVAKKYGLGMHPVYYPYYSWSYHPYLRKFYILEYPVVKYQCGFYGVAIGSVNSH